MVLTPHTGTFLGVFHNLLTQGTASHFFVHTSMFGDGPVVHKVQSELSFICHFLSTSSSFCHSLVFLPTDTFVSFCSLCLSVVSSVLFHPPLLPLPSLLPVPQSFSLYLYLYKHIKTNYNSRWTTAASHQFPLKDRGMEKREDGKDEDGDRVGVLGGNKWPDNTDIMRENERDDSRADTGGGPGGEGRGKKAGEVRWAAELCKS